MVKDPANDVIIGAVEGRHKLEAGRGGFSVATPANPGFRGIGEDCQVESC
jgi:hypothetical protein